MKVRTMYSFACNCRVDRGSISVLTKMGAVAELDSSNLKAFNESRIMRIARGSGRIVRDVMEVLEQYKRMTKLFSNVKGLKKLKSGDMSSNKSAQQLMSNVMSPQMLQQFGGMGGLQNLMSQMGANI